MIKSKSRNVQKLLIYLSGIVTSILKNGNSDCASQSVSPRFPSCGSRFDVFLIILSNT